MDEDDGVCCFHQRSYSGPDIRNCLLPASSPKTRNRADTVEHKQGADTIDVPRALLLQLRAFPGNTLGISFATERSRTGRQADLSPSRYAFSVNSIASTSILEEMLRSRSVFYRPDFKCLSEYRDDFWRAIRRARGQSPF